MAKQSPIFDVLLLAADIDKTVHEPARLLILSMLYVIDSADFVFLHKQSGLTRGNFSTHMSKLEENNYVEVKKEFIDKKPTTIYSITAQGRAALEQYRDQMKRILTELE
ncbi:MAG: transcriptional regulator [Anaerolineales bacterium]|jgi:DNA-binding MarR family transcriptional regulator